MKRTATILILVLATVASAGPKSSLLKSGKKAPAPVVNDRGEEIIPTTEATVANTSLVAVRKPEPRKFKLHDLVTVIVREESTSKSEASTEMDKETKLNAEIAEWIKFHINSSDIKLRPDEGLAAAPPKIDVGMSRETGNEGASETKDSFLTKITTEIIDIKPNGNLVLEAVSKVEHNEEKLTLTLTGIVAPSSISAKNTVESSAVARLTVSKKTEGAVRDGQKRGWLVKLLDIISPF
jgi:flagellar L-ring protein precursor FlgH